MTELPSQTRGPSARTVKAAKIVAVVAGAVGILLAVASPFLPVTYTKAEIAWPQASASSSAPVVENIAAPNVSFNPVSMDVAVPCSLATLLPADGGVLLSTVPKTGVDARKVGLFINATHDNLLVSQRNAVLLSIPRDQAQRNPDCRIVVHADTTGTRGGVEGMDLPDASFDIRDPNARPQIIGVYTDLPSSAPTAGLSFRSTIDNRFSTSPTALKRTLLIVGVISTIVSLIALAVLDARDGRRLRRLLPRRWWRPTLLDGFVTAVLLIWLMIGGNTADDGYQVTVGRVAPGAGYLDNYYRYFGVPQDPFGWHYQYLAKWMEVSTAIPWLRLLPLLFALAGWFLISRVAIPRLGRTVAGSGVARWAAALAFLAVWLPFNNGLRVEPAITVGILLTWVLVERAIATGRLLPFGLAIVSAAFTLTIHPVGAVAAVALLAGLRPLLKRVGYRRRRDGLAPMLVPLVAAGLVVLYEIFADQPLATILEGVKAQGVVGPTNKWWTEAMRYYILLNPTPDGSIARRVGIFVTILSVLLVVLVLIRRHSVPGVATAALWRLVAVTGGAVAVLAFVPTKATHQMGIFASLAGPLAAAATAFLQPHVLRRSCNRTFFAAASAYALAVAFAGRNQWWYVGSYGIPWSDDTPHIAGIGLFWPIFVVAVVLTAIGLWQYYRDDGRAQFADRTAPYTRPEPGRFANAPMYSLVVVSAVILAFNMISFGKAARTQSDSWTWASSNIASMRGNPCALADAVLVEADPNTGVLEPARLPGQPALTAGQALAGGPTAPAGFSPNGVPSHLESAEEGTSDSGDSNAHPAQPVDDDQQQTQSTSDPRSDTSGGTTGSRGVNGSSVKLPFGLDPQRVPVLGSFGSGDGGGHLTSGWYQLPARSAEQPLITLSAAGAVESVDELAVRHPGQQLRLEAGRVEPDGTVQTVASLTPFDAGGAPEWRNLRFPMSAIPHAATVVRIVADDTSPNYDAWLAVTPPRATKLQTLNSLVGSDDPVLLDWEVAFAFPCQRPAAAVHGVLETPKWRITPDAVGERVNSAQWMAGDYGGPLGITENELRPTEVPAYLENDWGRDWGSLQRFTPLLPQRDADITLTEEDHTGTWTPGPMRVIRN
ncbi:arabinosyltransferase domain-containing protein [Gordonia neofelifaecis]|uniref:Cell wall arabinan synthesis protein n=1 Tax=Gordonia neofelifaecis NRRL B-59395 TaxID=644548 RepID=F1YP63_9ACTN|nr:arabinosyltransferase domain-containing protein [Gordonia neofelifaecis]EGD53512.1 cell wall arabinan synthesis protein [Gordonia neofelifaecis NRRL B-59395]